MALSGGKKFPRTSLYCISGCAVTLIYLCIWLVCFLNLEIIIPNMVWSAGGNFLTFFPQTVYQQCSLCMYSVKTTVLELKFMIQHEPKGFECCPYESVGEQDNYQTIKKQYR